MIFNYKALDGTGAEQKGTIEAVSSDAAITALQHRGLIISAITSADDTGGSFLNKNLTIFQKVSNKEVVFLSRQLAIMFEAQVSALRIFRLLGAEIENPLLHAALTTIADDIQGGISISKALSKHPKIFSNFYVNMVKSGEESGKLDQIFVYLADYLDRTYAVTSKTRNALIYPAFVVVVFFAVMLIMFTAIIPKITAIIVQSGQQIPIYTRIIMGISDFLLHYGIYLAIAVLVGAYFLVQYIRTPTGARAYDEFRLGVPYVGTLYRKLYISRIADNMNTMLSSGISMLKALEITASVVGSPVYNEIILNAIDSVRGGAALSDALVEYKEIPAVMVQMIKVGEETGELGHILKTMAKFYEREVTNAIDTLVGLIEPVMIVVLGLGVGILLVSVLMPIYNLTSAF